jgi:2,4-dienoyl-CoA reductase-like NADH-dependent reductase (Old Yellow Enzyme family)
MTQASLMPWSPLKLGCGALLRNRFVLAPMTTNSSNEDGSVSSAELAYIRRRCVNEFAAGITSCAYVHDDGRSWQGIGAAHPRHLDSLRDVANSFHSGGGLAILQLYDGGRIADPKFVRSELLRAPSPIPSLRQGALIPREMSGLEIESLIESFVRAAKLGEAAGFDGIEIHGANHYLIHQFFSPRSNRRNDRWGGDAENRMRFSLELTAAIRRSIKNDMILGYRINPLETEPGGYSLADAAALCSRLCDVEVDYIHISMDDFRKRSPQREDRDWTAPNKAAGLDEPISMLSQAVNGRAAVIASGGIKSLDDAREVLAAGATLLAVGRASLIDPEWLTKLARNEVKAIRQQLPATSAQIETDLTIPAPMVRYILSRPRWMPQETLSG